MSVSVGIRRNTVHIFKTFGKIALTGKNASVEEVLAMVEEIVEETNDISGVSDTLKSQVEKYKL